MYCAKIRQMSIIVLLAIYQCDSECKIDEKGSDSNEFCNKNPDMIENCSHFHKTCNSMEHKLGLQIRPNSSFIDNRMSPPVLRIFAIVHKEFAKDYITKKISIELEFKNSDNLPCEFKKLKTTDAKEVAAPQAAVIINCKLEIDTLSKTIIGTTNVNLRIRNDAEYEKCSITAGHVDLNPKTSYKIAPFRLGIILKKLYNHYGDWLELALWIEYHQYAGVEQFWIFVECVDQQVQIVLDYYVKKKLVTILPVNPETAIDAEGTEAEQKIQYNSLLYELMHKVKSVALIDKGEYIMPTNEQRLHTPNWLLKMIEPVFASKQMSTLVFNIFALSLFMDTDLHPSLSRGVPDLSMLKRKDMLTGPQCKTKSIVWPEYIIINGIHEPQTFLDKEKHNKLLITEKELYVADYRQKMGPIKCEPKVPADSNPMRWMYRILKKKIEKLIKSISHTKILRSHFDS